MATFLSLILAVAAFKCTDVPLQALIHMHNKLSDYIAFMHVYVCMYVCMYVCSTLHVYVTSILVDDLMAAWLVEMNSIIEMYMGCICKCRGTEKSCHCTKKLVVTVLRGINTARSLV